MREKAKAGFYLTVGFLSVKIKRITMAQLVEQRKMGRVSYPLRVSCIGDYKVFDAETDNFSFFGACLLSPVEVSAGQGLGIILKLPGKQGFSVIPAEVLWSGIIDTKLGEYKYRLGVRYLYLSAGQQRVFEEMLRILK